MAFKTKVIGSRIPDTAMVNQAKAYLLPTGYIMWYLLTRAKKVNPIYGEL